MELGKDTPQTSTGEKGKWKGENIRRRQLTFPAREKHIFDIFWATLTARSAWGAR